MVDTDNKEKTIISERLLKTLKICFWLNIVTFIGLNIWSIVAMTAAVSGEIYQPDLFVGIMIGILELPIFFLFGYSLYFFYKNDKYSKSGIYFLFFHILYAHIYFYKVIWKRKRELINSYESEQVLGNKIFIETEEE
jgi:hypothetical protein